MANYSYINLPVEININEFERLLKSIVETKFGDKLIVSIPDWEPELNYSNHWLVEVPNSSDLNSAGENLGFTIQLRENKKELTFRGSPDTFEDWIRGVVREKLARFFNTEIYYDSLNESRHPDLDIYDYPSFDAYLARNFKNFSDAEFILERYRNCTPLAFWSSP